ncbi:MAG TPA: LysM peptidoglycan-binding domain-containing protein [Actinomycetes bacterium]|nr:LysM peptidoglycan-binding domain-containing protein [Actinomycetes bacterium]
MTARGRVVVVAILAAPLLIAISLLFLSQVDASSDPTAPRPYPMVVVQPGDTLWTIAGRIAPDRDPRAVIHQIREINGLSGASIQAGQRLAVPPG